MKQHERFQFLHRLSGQLDRKLVGGLCGRGVVLEWTLRQNVGEYLIMSGGSQ